jgi:hypothetical protein
MSGHRLRRVQQPAARFRPLCSGAAPRVAPAWSRADPQATPPAGSGTHARATAPRLACPAPARRPGCHTRCWPSLPSRSRLAELPRRPVAPPAIRALVSASSAERVVSHDSPDVRRLPSALRAAPPPPRAADRPRRGESLFPPPPAPDRARSYSAHLPDWRGIARHPHRQPYSLLRCCRVRPSWRTADQDVIMWP